MSDYDEFGASETGMSLMSRDEMTNGDEFGASMASTKNNSGDKSLMIASNEDSITYEDEFGASIGMSNSKDNTYNDGADEFGAEDESKMTTDLDNTSTIATDDKSQTTISRLSTEEGIKSNFDHGDDDSRLTFDDKTETEISSVGTSLTKSFQPHPSMDLQIIQESSMGSGLSPPLHPESSTLVKKNRAERTMSVTQLRFDKLQFYGREQEKAFLRETIQRLTKPTVSDSTATNNQTMTTPQQEEQKNGDVPSGNSEKLDQAQEDPSESVFTVAKKSELVLIGGVSGCGKSALAQYMKKITQRAHGLCISGKFDMNLRGEPYSAIKMACLQIIGELLHLDRLSDKSRFESIQKEISEAVGTELGLLIDLIPELQDVYPEERSSASETALSAGSKDRLHHAFRRFIRVISAQFTPFTMILDDIHRSDTPSMELIHSLLSDAENSHGLIVVGTYRSNEVDDNLSEFIQQSKETAGVNDSGLANVTEIELKNFDEKEVRVILGTLLGMDDGDEISSLATICHKRTLGNIFYVKSFLGALKDGELIRFNFGMHKWVWDENAILASTTVTKNIVDLLRRRFLELPDAVQRRLAGAAFLGASFDVETEEIVWNRVSTVLGDMNSEAADSWLELSEASGILERAKPSAYRWAHDQIQEAAQSLISDDERPSFLSVVGRALLEDLPQKKQDEYLFVMVDVLNSGTPAGGDEAHLEMAMLNLKATRKASEQVAVESSIHYSNIGIEHLPDNAWEEHGELALALYTHSVEATSTLLRLKGPRDKHFAEIARQDRPFKDKIRAYTAVITSCCREVDDNVAKGFDLLIHAISELGYSFPKSPFIRLTSTLSGLLKIKRKIKRLSESDVLSMTPVTESESLIAMELLSSGMDTVYTVQPSLVGPWAVKLGEIALRNGLCAYTQVALAHLGIVFLLMKDFTTAAKCATLAEALLLRNENAVTNPRTVVFSYAFALPFRRTYHQLIPGVLQGYRMALAQGEMNSCAATAVFYNYMSFMGGSSLKHIDADCRKFTIHMKQIGNTQACDNLLVLRQGILNLRGGSGGNPDPFVLQGEAIPDLASFKARLVVESQKSLLYYIELAVCAVLGDWERGAHAALTDNGNFQKVGPGIFHNLHETFCRGLCLFGMAHKSKQSKYKKAAKKVLSTVSIWAKAGNPNVLHVQKLFQAELSVLNGQKEKAYSLYHKALCLATRAGFIHDAAIINERCADFCRNIKDSPEEAAYRIGESIKLFEEWGSHTKAQMLRLQYSSIQAKPSDIYV